MQRSWNRRGGTALPLEGEDADAQRYRQRLKSSQRRAVLMSLVLVFGGGLALVLVGIWLPRTGAKEWPSIVDLSIVASFCAFVAYAELVSRYHDSPVGLISAPPTPYYLLINIAAGIAALLIVYKLGVVAGTRAPRLYAILLAGFGAISFFRTSLFMVRIGDTDVGVGPSALLQSLLGAADRMIDRDQAQSRATDVSDIMRNIDFAKANQSLPSLCFVLVENITPADQVGLREQISRLAADRDISPEQKSVILGVYLLRQVGADVLALAVEALGPEIRRQPPVGATPPEPLDPTEPAPSPARNP